MKNFFLAFLLFVSFNLSGEEWESHWIAALENYSNENYTAAEHNLTLALNVLENKHAMKNSSIYVDRAHTYLHLNRYEEALSDAHTALLSPTLNSRERIRAVFARVTAKTVLGLFSETYDEDIEFLVRNLEVQVENMENHVMLRNLPTNEVFKNSLKHFFIHTGLCENEQDIRILGSGTWIINKNLDKQLDNYTLRSEQCKNWCNANALTAITWCASFPEYCVIDACNLAVREIQANCHSCCQTGLDQDTCASPFGDIVGPMQKYLRSTCGFR